MLNYSEASGDQRRKRGQSSCYMFLTMDTEAVMGVHQEFKTKQDKYHLKW